MGFIFVLTPVVGWTWPALAPILGATAAAMGYKMLTDPANPLLRGKLTKQLESMRRVNLPLDSILTDLIAEDLGHEERMQFQHEEIVLVFRKDARGKFFVEVSGPRRCTATELQVRAEDFAREIVKKFAYHKMVEQIERRGATVVEEGVEEDGRIVVKARQWR
jgi:hypothetical protein